MRGRGRGRGRGRSRTDFGVPRHELVTEEQPAYPCNPKLQCAGGLVNEEEQLVVAANRLLVNYLKFESPFQVASTVSGKTAPSGGASSGRAGYLETSRISDESSTVSSVSIWGAASMTRQQQKDAISALTGVDYFPSELLLNEYVGGRASRRPPVMRRVARRTEGTGEGVQDGGEEGGGDNEDEENAQEEPGDFGGDDYAKDHEADDDFDEANDGGDNDDTF